MWCERDSAPPPRTLPRKLAVPWTQVSESLSMPPVLVYATYNLLNWRRLDPHKPVELGNIVCLNVRARPECVRGWKGYLMEASTTLGTLNLSLTTCIMIPELPWWPG